MASNKPLEVHLGWHFSDTSKPLLFSFGKLRYHGAILAQSGAGKSFLVGRLVEELLVKTLAQVVVIDTNADFRNAYQMADTSQNPEIAQLLIDDVSVAHGFDTAEFAMRLRAVSKTYFTNRTAVDPTNGVEWNVPYVSWNELSRPFQMEVLGLELGRNPDEVAALYRVDQRLWDEDPSNLLVSPTIMDKELELLGSTSAVTTPSTTLSLQLRFRQAAQLDLWRHEAGQVDMSSCFEKEPKPRLLVLDIPAIAQVIRPKQNGRPGADRKRAMILVGYLLEVLWKRALKDWDEAMKNQSQHIKRLPTFLVIDEAHNFVPFDVPLDPLASRISDLIQRIAAEGRKYGLFLILATQRPQKVRKGLLQECENVCLLRLQSPIDREIAGGIWGIEKGDPKSSISIANFQKGQGLLFGHWSEGEDRKAGEIIFKAAPRRTKETGGDLRDEDWILTR